MYRVYDWLDENLQLSQARDWLLHIRRLTGELRRGAAGGGGSGEGFRGEEGKGKRTVCFSFFLILQL